MWPGQAKETGDMQLYSAHEGALLQALVCSFLTTLRANAAQRPKSLKEEDKQIKAIESRSARPTRRPGMEYCNPPPGSVHAGQILELILRCLCRVEGITNVGSCLRLGRCDVALRGPKNTKAIGEPSLEEILRERNTETDCNFLPWKHVQSIS